jgi:hypothetical protein
LKLATLFSSAGDVLIASSICPIPGTAYCQHGFPNPYKPAHKTSITIDHLQADKYFSTMAKDQRKSVAIIRNTDAAGHARCNEFKGPYSYGVYEHGRSINDG